MLFISVKWVLEMAQHLGALAALLENLGLTSQHPHDSSVIWNLSTIVYQEKIPLSKKGEKQCLQKITH